MWLGVSFLLVCISGATRLCDVGFCFGYVLTSRSGYDSVYVLLGISTLLTPLHCSVKRVPFMSPASRRSMGHHAGSSAGRKPNRVMPGIAQLLARQLYHRPLSLVFFPPFYSCTILFGVCSPGVADWSVRARSPFFELFSMHVRQHPSRRHREPRTLSIIQEGNQ